jgi:hypothetical protein
MKSLGLCLAPDTLTRNVSRSKRSPWKATGKIA